MVSIYDSKGKEKSMMVYRAEVWAHDLTKSNLMLQLNNKKAGKIERKALIKEFHSRYPGTPVPRMKKAV